MPLVSTRAIVLSALRYGETSKILRLATEDYGIQSVIAKGAFRPRSRFGAALQLLSEGQAQLILAERRELNPLTAFDVTHIPVGIAADVERYATANALAELMLRFAPAQPHAESFQLLSDALRIIEHTPEAASASLGLRILWRMVGVLGFAPSLDACVRDGAPVRAGGGLAFAADEGGALCEVCAVGRSVSILRPSDRAALVALLDPAQPLPPLTPLEAAAHRRLLARYIRAHLSEGGTLPALTFWHDRPWAAR